MLNEHISVYYIVKEGCNVIEYSKYIYNNIGVYKPLPEHDGSTKA